MGIIGHRYPDYSYIGHFNGFSFVRRYELNSLVDRKMTKVFLSETIPKLNQLKFVKLE